MTLQPTHKQLSTHAYVDVTLLYIVHQRRVVNIFLSKAFLFFYKKNTAVTIKIRKIQKRF